ncbi:ABC transporter permease [Nocardia takedensis]|uniref:ABC transporter permease n=1 Tax=Nocardia takedensis TaxID=259390 RepID=UPI00031CDA6A|nr:ABC transporter permease [Nocardia takedensis]
MAQPGPGLVILCVVLVAATAAVYGLARLGPIRVAPGAAVRAVVQLGAVALVLAVALERLWSALLVLAVMFTAAVLTAARRARAPDALLPGVDQTRTVGLVTLPGAFVGVLVASGSAYQAAAVQILVLLALLLAQSVAVAVTIELVARGLVRRG